MINESALLESKTLRDGVLERTDVLTASLAIFSRRAVLNVAISKAYETTGPPSESWTP